MSRRAAIQEDTEETVTEDALLSSLDELVKAAGADSAIDKLRKGGIVNSGHIDERGEVGGGTNPDAGQIEQLMIGKLVAGGMLEGAAAEVVGEMMGALSEAGLLGKAHDEPDEDDEGGAGDKDENDMSAYARGYFDAIQKQSAKKSLTKGPGDEDEDDEVALEKSIRSSFEADEEIKKGVNVSPFLEAFTDKMIDSLGTVVKSVGNEAKKQDKMNKAMAVAMVQLGKLVKSQQGVISELGSRLGVVERQPLPQKGVTNIQTARALKKGGEQAERSQALTKSQVSAALTYLNLEKGMKDIGGTRTAQLATMAEAGGTIPRDVVDTIQKYAAAHPDERQAMFSYQ